MIVTWQFFCGSMALVDVLIIDTESLQESTNHVMSLGFCSPWGKVQDY